MATNFPTSLDTFVNPVGTDNLATVNHASQHDNINDAVAALEAKVGVNGSAVTSSLDYKVAHISGYSGGFVRASAALATLDPTATTGSNGTFGTNVQLTYFTAAISITTTQVRIQKTTAGSGAGTIGLYSVDASDNGTLLTTATVASYAGTGAATFSWAVSQALTAGQRYAVGIKGDGSSLALAGVFPGNNNNECQSLPRLCGSLASGTQASFSAGGVSNNSSLFYATIL